MSRRPCGEYCGTVTPNGLCTNKAKYRTWHKISSLRSTQSLGVFFVCGTHKNSLSRFWGDKVYFEAIKDE